MDLILLAIVALLIIIGIVILAVIVGAILYFLPAIVIAGVVWYLTRDSANNLLYTGIAFLIMTIIMVIVRRR